MTLRPVSLDEIDALSQGSTLGLPTAPGWPHENTAAGLSFGHSGGAQFLILDGAGRIAGDCGTKSAPRDGVVEIGYGLAAQSRGKGLGSAAVGDLVERLRALPEVSAIEAEIHVSNTASRRVVERLGFGTDGAAEQGYLRYRLTVR